MKRQRTWTIRFLPGPDRRYLEYYLPLGVRGIWHQTTYGWIDLEVIQWALSISLWGTIGFVALRLVS